MNLYIIHMYPLEMFFFVSSIAMATRENLASQKKMMNTISQAMNQLASILSKSKTMLFYLPPKSNIIIS